MAGRHPQALHAFDLAHERPPVERLRASAGTRSADLGAGERRQEAVPVARSRSTQEAGSGSSRRKVEPSEVTPSAVTALKTPPGSAVPAATASTPTSSTTWRGGASSSSSTTTPQTGVIGFQARVVSITSGVHGPAVTSTAPAGRRTPDAITPWARPAPDHGQATSCSWMRAPRAYARRANASVAAAGRTGKPVSSRQALRPSASAGSSICSSPPCRIEGRRSGTSRPISAATSVSCAGSGASSSTPAGCSGKAKPSSSR